MLANRRTCESSSTCVEFGAPAPAQGIDLPHHRLDATQQPITQRFHEGEIDRQVLDHAQDVFLAADPEIMRRVGKGLLQARANRWIVERRDEHRRVGLRGGTVQLRAVVGVAASAKPTDQLHLELGAGDLDMRRVRLPARLPGQHLGRQRLARGQGRHELKRLGDPPEHLAVGGFIVDAELALQRAERHHNLLLAEAHDHHRRAVRGSAAECHVAEQREDPMMERAVGMRGVHSRVADELPNVWRT